MLSDNSIIRPWKPSLFLRIYQKSKNVIGKYGRYRINKKMRSSLKKTDFSIIASFCGGGTLYHDLNLKFLSPTINLAFDGSDFVKFCSNLEYYLKLELEEVKTDVVSYPVGRLGDVEIRFVHYHTFEEAKVKWEERAKRINYNKIFIMACDRDGMNSVENMEDFDKLPYKKVMFTSKEYSQYPWAVHCSCFSKYHCVGVMTGCADFMGNRYYEKYTDIVECLNSDNWYNL